MVNKYYKWLSETFCNKKIYSFLLQCLWDKEFYFLIKEDENRLIDGLYLRYLFAEEFQINHKKINDQLGKCRVLEILIALSNKGISAISYEKTKITQQDFFWIMIQNLKLIQFTNLFCVENDGLNEIDDILSRFLDRKYAKNGENGGLFPLKSSAFNQKKREIWLQMNDFILEKKWF